MDADTDAVFVGEAGIDRRRAQEGVTNRAGRANSGEENTLLARGGIDTNSTVEAREDDPLLAGSTHTDDGDKNPAHEWASAVDFQHMPWYKRPSVCLQFTSGL